jgi:DNA repair protein RadA/Sms
LQEEVIVQTRGASSSRAVPVAAPLKLEEITGSHWVRQTTNIAELDRVLGGGLVPGGVVLVGGDPGIGKSTLLMQLAGQLAQRAISVLYVSGEESQQQIKLRADRLQVTEGPIFIAAETELDAIQSQLGTLKPQVVIIDSIQTVYSANLTSAPGTVGQIRESASRLIRYAKDTGTVLFLVGHVTKDGSIGPNCWATGS